MKKIITLIQKKIQFIYLLLILIISFFTYLNNYNYPPALFWDENYHIASSEKYLNGVMFMEPHPPLGKLLIALSEKIINPNKNLDKTSFLKTDHIKNIPEGYNFSGVRFASAFLSFISPILFFLILIQLFNNIHFSFLFTSLILFDNALIVHSRSAMLEGQQIFFILLAFLYFLIIFKDNRINNYKYLILSLITGIAISIKVNSMILCLLFIIIIIKEYYNDIIKLNFSIKLIKEILIKTLTVFAGIFFIIFIAFYIHFALGKKIIDNRYYNAKKTYKEILKKGETANPLYFFIMFKDNLEYMKNYQKGVPRLDPCKEGENGSYPIGWPLGIKSINYRWAKNNNQVRYIYLQGNPITWFIGFISMLLSFILIGSFLFFNNKITNIDIFIKLIIFTSIYLVYMLVMLKIQRVMYLYHYFIPLIISYINSYLIFNYILEKLISSKNKTIYIVVILLVIIIFCVFLFYSPLTYYKPLTTEQFVKRIWTGAWKLQYIK